MIQQKHFTAISIEKQGKATCGIGLKRNFLRVFSIVLQRFFKICIPIKQYKLQCDFIYKNRYLQFGEYMLSHLLRFHQTTRFANLPTFYCLEINRGMQTACKLIEIAGTDLSSPSVVILENVTQDTNCPPLTYPTQANPLKTQHQPSASTASRPPLNKEVSSLSLLVCYIFENRILLLQLRLVSLFIISSAQNVCKSSFSNLSKKRS